MASEEPRQIIGDGGATALVGVSDG